MEIRGRRLVVAESSERATLNARNELEQLRKQWMSKPLDNPLSDQGANPSSDQSSEIGVMEEGVLPEILRGRMFCTAHGRQCYRSIAFTGEFVWICPDERHVVPLRG